VTVEPGVYFIDLLLDEARADGRGRHINWEAIERLRPFGGIRIEDDLLITSDGIENLSAATPVEPAAVEARSREMQYEEAKNRIVYTGEVEIRQGDILTRSPEAIVLLTKDGETIDRLLAGEPVEVHQGVRRATGERGTYTPANETFVLMGEKVVLIDVDRRLEGRILTFEVGSERVRVDGRDVAGLVFDLPDALVVDLARLPVLMERTTPSAGRGIADSRHVRVAHPALVVTSRLVEVLVHLGDLRGTLAIVDPVSVHGREAVELLRRAFGEHLDRAVEAIANPAVHREPPRHPLVQLFRLAHQLGKVLALADQLCLSPDRPATTSYDV